MSIDTAIAPAPSVTVNRLPIMIKPEKNRVLIRPFFPGDRDRHRAIAQRVAAIPADEVENALTELREHFGMRHSDTHAVFRRHYERVKDLIPGTILSSGHQLLIGAYFTSEYALESAALFNPSIVPHPDQEGMALGETRIIMSLRATGEGHISSIEFRDGVLHEGGSLDLAPAHKFVMEPRLMPDPQYIRRLFRNKLTETGHHGDVTSEVLEDLPKQFSRGELINAVHAFCQRRNGIPTEEEAHTLSKMQWLAESNYDIQFSEDQRLSERVIFPFSSNETNGIEDARFVRFCDDDGEVTYYATYTAYNGRAILPQILETKDFLRFHIRTLNGTAVQNKGMALFPRKIGGQYAMISRQDNESLYIMFSEHPHFWWEATKLIGPIEPWEFIQIGNCGSPIETEKGWILLTHGVGPMRRYCIGAILLDLEDPTKVLARLREPLIQPNENEREGYVPNVVYSCGAMLHHDLLVIPYAMSDYASSIATVKVDELLSAMEPETPEPLANGSGGRA